MGSRSEAARCRSCSAEIVWTLTSRGKRMPVDANPSADGTLRLERKGGELRSVVDMNARSCVRLHRSHFATCPNAARHRIRG